MALTNQDKQLLAQWVKNEIALGHSKRQAMDRLNKIGYKRNTIAAYYEVFSKK
jgi:hypothetical protein